MMTAGQRVGALEERPADRAGLLALVGAIVLIAWCGAVAAGLGRALSGGDSTAAELEFALYLPGVLIGSGLIAYGALRRLSLHAPRWVPRQVPPDEAAAMPPPIALPGEDDATALVQRRVAREARSEALAIVHLGPTCDPAWAAWGLRWEAPGLGAGLVPLVSGARVLLGRDPAADVVVRLDQVSWHHLELDVQEARVIVFELGSSNGTRSASEEPLQERTPWPWAPGAMLQLASPVALTLTLEPLR